MSQRKRKYLSRFVSGVAGGALYGIFLSHYRHHNLSTAIGAFALYVGSFMLISVILDPVFDAFKRRPAA